MTARPIAFALLCGTIAAAVSACTPAMLAAFGVIAPVATSALDLAGRFAPQAAPADLAEIARRLDALKQCDATVHAMTATDAPPTDAEQLRAASIELAAAARGLVDALAAAKVASAGKDGGT